jgi:hypothetical protein
VEQRVVLFRTQSQALDAQLPVVRFQSFQQAIAR